MTCSLFRAIKKLREKKKKIWSKITKRGYNGACAEELFWVCFSVYFLSAPRSARWTGASEFVCYGTFGHYIIAISQWRAPTCSEELHFDSYICSPIY